MYIKTSCHLYNGMCTGGFSCFFQTCAPPVARHRGGFNIGSFLFVVGGATLPITSAHYDASSVRLRGGRPDRKVKYHNWSLLARGGVYFVLTAENRTAPFGGNSLFQSRENPGLCECRPMVGHQLPKLGMRVRLPSFAPGALSAAGNFASCFQKQEAVFCPWRVEVSQPRAYMRMSSSGKTLAFQAKNVGSIPTVRSKYSGIAKW